MKIKVCNRHFYLIRILINLSIFFIVCFPFLGKYGRLIREICINSTVIWGCFLLLKNRNIKFNLFFILYGCYILVSVISVFWCVNLSALYIRVRDMINCFLLCLVIFNFIKNKQELKNILDIYLLGVIVISIYCFFNGFTLSWPRLGAVPFFIAGENQIYYSCILIYATCYSFFKMLNKSKDRMLYFVTSIFLFGCCSLTAIRKCILIPLIFIIIYICIKYKFKFFKLLISFIIGLGLIILMAIIINRYSPSMYIRMKNLIGSFTTYNSIIDQSFLDRAFLGKIAIKVFLKYPVLGVGIGQFQFYSFNNGGPLLYAHNNFLEILANSGLIGFTLYYSIYIFIFFKSSKIVFLKKLDNHMYLYIFCFMCAMLFMEFGQVQYYQIFYVPILSIIFSIVDINKINKIIF